MSTLRVVASISLFAVVLLATAAESQNFAPAGPGFHVEVAARPGGSPAVEGYVYNEGYVWVSDVRLRVQVFDADGAKVEEAVGWASGNVGPNGRASFTVKLKRLGTTYRVRVESFNVVPQGGA